MMRALTESLGRAGEREGGRDGESSSKGLREEGEEARHRGEGGSENLEGGEVGKNRVSLSLSLSLPFSEIDLVSAPPPAPEKQWKKRN